MMRRSPESSFSPSEAFIPPRSAPIAAVARLARHLSKRQTIIVNLSGRGDKDMMTVGDYLGVKL